MTKTFAKSDKVAWNISQGETLRTVERKLTKPIEIKGHHVSASEDNPEYLVTNDKSGDAAAHKPGALKIR
jgi:hypothetical protein